MKRTLLAVVLIAGAGGMVGNPSAQAASPFLKGVAKTPTGQMSAEDAAWGANCPHHWKRAEIRDWASDSRSGGQNKGAPQGRRASSDRN